jgi:hypothetical protein
MDKIDTSKIDPFGKKVTWEASKPDGFCIKADIPIIIYNTGELSGPSQFFNDINYVTPGIFVTPGKNLQLTIASNNIGGLPGAAVILPDGTVLDVAVGVKIMSVKVYDLTGRSILEELPGVGKEIVGGDINSKDLVMDIPTSGKSGYVRYKIDITLATAVSEAPYQCKMYCNVQLALKRE